VGRAVDRWRHQQLVTSTSAAPGLQILPVMARKPGLVQALSSMTRRALGFCVLVMLLAAPVASAQAPSAATVLANVQQFYANTNQLTATFRQTVTNAAFNTSKASDGRLWVRKPSDFRWDYLEKRNGAVVVTKSFIFDGATLWLVDHANKQIVQSQTQSGVLPAAVSFLAGSGSLGSQFAVAINTSGTFGTKGTVVLELTPNQPSAQYKKLFFVIDQSDWHVKESIVIDSSGDTNRFSFYAPNLTSAVKATLFQVNPAALPKYKLTRLNQTGSGAAGSGTIAPAP
jgi:outer membrane lipoprotein carrier protein